MRRRQNNPILTGEAGVGKTAVAEGFALRLVAGDVPAELQNVSVRTLDLGLLQAGAGVKGEFENRLKSVIQEVKSSPTPIILFTPGLVADLRYHRQGPICTGADDQSGPTPRDHLMHRHGRVPVAAPVRLRRPLAPSADHPSVDDDVVLVARPLDLDHPEADQPCSHVIDPLLAEAPASVSGYWCVG